MKTYSYYTNYAEDQTKRERLYHLFDPVFNIPVETFRDFYAREFWDDTYRPFTYFHEEKAVANVSLFDMPMLIGGEKVSVKGIQSVMTHPEYRGNGLMKSLFAEALAFVDQEEQPSFLITSSPELYTPFGFKTIPEYYFIRTCNHVSNGSSRLQKVNVFNEDDLASLRSMFQKRATLSRQFMPISYESSFFLNMYNPYVHDLLHYSDELDAYLVFEVVEGILQLYDIIAEELPDLKEISHVIQEPFEKIALYFNPDQFSEKFEAVKYDSVDHLMFRGNVGVPEKKVKLPITAEF